MINGFGLVFTLGGTIVGLWLAKESWWISILIVVALTVAFGAFAYRLNRNLRQMESRHETELQTIRQLSKAELEGVRSEKDELSRRLREAEQKLNEVPLGIVKHLERAVASHEFGELVKKLTAHADFVSRMRIFVQASTKLLALRTLVTQGGAVFVVAKAAVPVSEMLRPGDPFLLVKRTSGGLETPIAWVVVHQPPTGGKEQSLFFRIENPLTGEVRALENLAEHGDVEKIGGYSLKPACDVEAFAGLEWSRLVDTLTRLADDMARYRGV